jgi:hypothetical protein
LLSDGGGAQQQPAQVVQQQERQERRDRERFDKKDRRARPAPLELGQAMPLVERALQVLERRGVQPQLGLLKSTMLQLDPAFTEKAYGANSFSEFVEKLKKGDFVNVSGHGGRYVIERKTSAVPERPTPKPEEALPKLRDVLETHRLEMEEGATADELQAWMQAEHPDFDFTAYGYQEFAEFLNYAQDKLVVRMEPDEERGLMVYLGAEFYPPALPEPPAPPPPEEEDEGPQPYVEGQPSLLEPNPPPPKPKAVKRTRKAAGGGEKTTRRPRKKKTD